MISIRFWTAILLSILILLVVGFLSLFFYREFEKALDERVLLQLMSIKRLKRVQIEEYIQEEWQLFLESPQSEASDQGDLHRVDSLCMNQEFESNNYKQGIYDITSCSQDGRLKLAFVTRKSNAELKVKLIGFERIQQILLERTGMGESGETYLVGDDMRLRSASRFFPDKSPYDITTDAPRISEALEGKDGIGIFKDYRDIDVYSAFHRVEVPGVNWVILSELDVTEGKKPLLKLKHKLFLIALLVLLFAIMAALAITNYLNHPLLRIRQLLHRMALGNFDHSIHERYMISEVSEIFVALENLKNSINEAIHFSYEIGKMNLNAEYKMSGDRDELGKSLIAMQQKLLEYSDLEKQNRRLSKKSLISGQEKERKRLSKELHDGLGLLLSSLKINIQTSGLSKEKKKEINELIDHTVTEIRRMIYDLMPPALEDFGVGGALSNFMEMVHKTSNLDVHFEDLTFGANSKIAGDMEVALFRVCQELVNNTLKHAKATKIALSLTEFEDRVSLFYVDNGIGFDIKDVYTGYGLKNIRERIEVFDGYLNFVSSENGTEVEVEIPLSYE